MICKDRHEMQVKTKTGEWSYFDDKKNIKDLEKCYQMYHRHSKYDARIIKITTCREVLKSTQHH